VADDTENEDVEGHALDPDEPVEVEVEADDVDDEDDGPDVEGHGFIQY
jgi:hypothetical protein